MVKGTKSEGLSSINIDNAEFYVPRGILIKGDVKLWTKQYFIFFKEIVNYLTINFLFGKIEYYSRTQNY